MMKILNCIVLICFLACFGTFNSCSEKDKIFIRIQPTGIPTITTEIINNSITATSVIAVGDVTGEGVAVVTEKGFEISMTDREGFRKLEYRSSGTGKFSHEITGLIPGKTYAIRAFAINNVGTAHGDVVSFNTLSKPVVTTDLITVLSQTVATVVGSVTKMSSSDIVERGICYGTAPAPTTENLRVVVPTNAVGTLSCNLQNLTPGTHYYARAYVCIYSDDGWLDLIPFYGNEITFVAGDPGSVL
jgi:hypothetical protein